MQNQTTNNNAKEVTFTTTSETFKTMIDVFDIRDQSDLDSLLEHLIEDAITKRLFR